MHVTFSYQKIQHCEHVFPNRQQLKTTHIFYKPFTEGRVTVHFAHYKLKDKVQVNWADGKRSRPSNSI